MVLKTVSRGRWYLVLLFFIVLNLLQTNAVYADISDQVNLYVADADYQGCIKYLQGLKEERSVGLAEEQIFNIDYLLAKTKSDYLDHLEKKQDWEAYYENVDVFNEQIIDAAKKYAGNDVTIDLIDLQRLAQKAYLRDDDEDAAQEVFDNFVNNIISYTQKTGDIAKFKEVAKLIAEDGHKRYVDQLFVAYKKYLLENKADPSSAMRLLEIADEYLDDGQIDMAIVIYNHYIDFAIANFSRDDAKTAMMVICDKFRDYGFVRGVDSDFAERIYSKAQKNFGVEIFAEYEVLERALNLEALKDYQRAQEEYKYFIKNFKASRFLDQAYCRLAVIQLFYLGQIEQGTVSFETLISQFESSDYLSFALYYTGLIKQFRQEYPAAAGLYDRVIARNKGFVKQAETRKAEINTGIAIDEAVSYPLKLIFDDYESSIVIDLKPAENQAFTGQEITWTAAAQDFSVGTVQPLFKYSWYWDLGNSAAPLNSASFETSYSTGLPKLVCFGAQSSGEENIVCSGIWIYDILLADKSKAVCKAGEEIDMMLKIVPACPQEKHMSFKWKIDDGSGPQFSEGKGFKHRFEKAGKYTAELEVRFKNKKAVKRFDIVVEDESKE